MIDTIAAVENRARSDRRVPGWVTPVVVCVVVVAVCLLCVAALGAIGGDGPRSAPPRRERLGWPVTAAICVLLPIPLLIQNYLQKRRLARIREDFARWQAASGWTPGRVDRVWPWTFRLQAPDMVTVTSAFDRELTGLPVTVGELSWIDNGLGDATDRWSGQGVFTVVRVPGSPPDFAVRRYRDKYRQRVGEDEFEQRFRTIFDDTVDAKRLDHEELRRAHVNSEIPPWTLLGGELFTIVSLDGPATPAAMESAAAGALRVVKLLDLRAE